MNISSETLVPMKLSLQPLMPRISTSMLRPFAFACLVAVASLGWTGWAAAAACSSTNYDLNTQAEVDALGATGCDSVSGYLVHQRTLQTSPTSMA